MISEDFKKFSGKYEKGENPDPEIKKEIEKFSKNNKLPCAVVFQMAKKLNLEVQLIGKTADLMDISLTKCQLGLFGYKPEKKIMKPVQESMPDLEKTILKAVTDNRLSCRKVWEIASECGVHKMVTAGVCERLEIRIKPCQIGAF